MRRFAVSTACRQIAISSSLESDDDEPCLECNDANEEDTIEDHEQPSPNLNVTVEKVNECLYIWRYID